MNLFKRIMIVFICLFLCVICVSCKKKNNYIDTIKMHRVEYFIDGTFYHKSYVNSGEKTPMISCEDTKMRNFKYWMLDNKPFNFSESIKQNYKLEASFDEIKKMSATEVSEKIEIFDSSYAHNVLFYAGVDYKFFVEITNDSASKVELPLLLKVEGEALEIEYNFVLDDASSKEMTLELESNESKVLCISWKLVSVSADYKAPYKIYATFKA